jgi:hypothetical protein
MRRDGIDNGALQTNLSQAFLKNKIMQDKLAERQRIYTIQLLKDMRDYELKKKLNKDLLNKWNKENDVRQSKANSHGHEQRRCVVRRDDDEQHTEHLDSTMSRQRAIVLPVEEEQRRLTIHRRVRLFLERNPSARVSPLSPRLTPSMHRSEDDDDKINKQDLESTWKEIHARSVAEQQQHERCRQQRRRPFGRLPSIQRSLPTSASLVPVVDTVDRSSSSSYKSKTRSTTLKTRATLNDSMCDTLANNGLESVKEGDVELVAMRSVRRPRKDPIDVNVLFEGRKRIYDMKKRARESHPCSRQYRIQSNSNGDRCQQVDHRVQQRHRLEQRPT